MGRVPVHVYSDIPWVPYAELFEASIGYITTFDECASLIDTLQKTLSLDELRERERHVLSLRESHFTAQGLMAQIQTFMQGSTTSLRCQKLPDSVRGEIMSLS
jgi:hypothetical protein